MLKKLILLLMKIFALFCVLLFVTFQASAAVQIDASSRFGAFDGIVGVTNLTWSHTVGNGNSRALFVGVSSSVSTLPGTAVERVSGVTYNGIVLTRIGTQFSPSAIPNNSVEIFRLVAPPSGTADIQVSIIPSTANYAIGGAVSFTGVDPANPNGSFNSTNGSNGMPSINVPDSVSGDIVFDTLSTSFNAQAVVAGANQSVCFPDPAPETNCRRGRGFFGTSDVGASSTETAFGPVTMSWGLQFDNDWALGAIAVKAFTTTAASGTISGRVLSSYGKGIPRVSISLTVGNGEVLTSQTNPFGYFSFNDLEINNTYVLQPRSKRFVFAPQVLTLEDSIMNIHLYPISK